MSHHRFGALVAPLLLVAACATPGDDDIIAAAVDARPEAVRAVRAAPGAAADAGTAGFEMVISTTHADGAVAFTTTGELDTDARAIAIEMDVGALFGDRPAEDLPPGMDEPAQVIVKDATIYLRVPALDELTGTSDWLAVRPGDVARPRRPEAGGGRAVYDPTTLLAVLRGASDDVEVIGSDEVRGVPTTRYSATVRLADALDEAPAGPREALEAQLDQLGVGDAPVPVEVWVDAEGLARRVIIGLAGRSGPADAEAVRVEVTIELFDYGQPVSIEVPPPDEVTPYGEAMAAMTRAFLEAGA